MLVEALAEFGADVVGAVFDWLVPSHDKGSDQPRPVAETLYEEHRPPPDTGMR